MTESFRLLDGCMVTLEGVVCDAFVALHTATHNTFYKMIMELNQHL